jgi:hypothetical protein
VDLAVVVLAVAMTMVTRTMKVLIERREHLLLLKRFFLFIFFLV